MLRYERKKGMRESYIVKIGFKCSRTLTLNMSVQIIQKLLLVNLVNEKTLLVERFNQRDGKCPRKSIHLQLKWPMSNLSRIEIYLFGNSARRKTNNVIGSDHVINVRRKVHTNSIICPQFSCTMHPESKVLQIHSTTKPCWKDNKQRFLLVCAANWALMELF
jgi:hypothetical protein